MLVEGSRLVIEGASPYCQYVEGLVAAQERYTQQQADIPRGQSDNGLLPPTAMSDEVLADCIFNPAPLIKKIETGLKNGPCEFTKTGKCRLAELTIALAANKGVKE